MARTELTVKGMKCAGCAGKVKTLLTQLGGVQGVEIRLAEHKVVVMHNDKVGKAGITDAIETAGYDVQ